MPERGNRFQLLQNNAAKRTMLSFRKPALCAGGIFRPVHDLDMRCHGDGKRNFRRVVISSIGRLEDGDKILFSRRIADR